MYEETNPYASPASGPADTNTEPEQRSWLSRTVRALTVGPALVLLVSWLFVSLTAPLTFPIVVGAMVLLHIVDRKLFESKKFVG